MGTTFTTLPPEGGESSGLPAPLTTNESGIRIWVLSPQQWQALPAKYRGVYNTMPVHSATFPAKKQPLHP